MYGVYSLIRLLKHCRVDQIWIMLHHLKLNQTDHACLCINASGSQALFGKVQQPGRSSCHI